MAGFVRQFVCTFVCISVCPSVQHKFLTQKQKSVIIKIGVNVLQDQSSQCDNLRIKSSKVKVRVTPCSRRTAALYVDTEPVHFLFVISLLMCATLMKISPRDSVINSGNSPRASEAFSLMWILRAETLTGQLHNLQKESIKRSKTSNTRLRN